MSAMNRTNDPSLQLPSPREDRPPLRANLLNTMQKANTTLTPLFPYMHPGAIVPTGALFIGGPGRDYGQFYHHNSVDEVIIAFVAKDATLRTGQLYNGGRVHGVNSFLKDQFAAGSYVVFTVTQRQLEQGPQPEAVTLLCESCRKEVFRTEYDATSRPDAVELDQPFSTPALLAAPVRAYNEDPQARVCADCGHPNPPFPLDIWGWEDYSRQSAVMGIAKRDLHGAAQP